MEWVPLLAGAAVAALLVPAGLRVLAESPFPAGVLAPVAALIALGPLAALQELAGWDLLRPDLVIFGALDEEESIGSFTEYGPTEPDTTALFAMPLALGVALLGLLDDLLPGRAASLLTAAGATALALLTFADHGLSVREYLLAVAVVVIATALFGRLGDRAVPAFVLLGAGLLVGTRDLEPLRAVGLFAGPLVVLAAYDQRRRATLGRTGTCLTGALAGLWIVLALDINSPEGGN